MRLCGIVLMFYEMDLYSKMNTLDWFITRVITLSMCLRFNFTDEGVGIPYDVIEQDEDDSDDLSCNEDTLSQEHFLDAALEAVV